MFNWGKMSRPEKKDETPKSHYCHEIAVTSKETHREGHHECYEDANHFGMHICWCKYGWF